MTRRQWDGGSRAYPRLRVLSVDPGREKCGLAVVDVRDGVLARGVVPTRVVGAVVTDWASAHHPTFLVVGGGTALGSVRSALMDEDLDLPLKIFPEARTTERAKVRYFEENPPRGWRRLVPRGLLSPPVPVDDYAAVLIAEGFLSTLASE